MSSECPVAGCAIPVDVVLKSSGSTLIGAHSTMLAKGTLALPLDGMVDRADEPIPCTESDKTLRILLEILHEDGRTTDAILKGIATSELTGVMNAAGKCGAAGISESGVTILREKVEDDAWGALIYALDHGDTITMNLAAPHTLARGKDQLEKLNDVTARAWYMYREQYLTLIDEIRTPPPPHINAKRKEHNCGGWVEYQDYAIGHVYTVSIESLASQVAIEGVKAVFPLGNWTGSYPCNPGYYGAKCHTCNTRAKKWLRRVEVLRERERAHKTFHNILQGLSKGS